MAQCFAIDSLSGYSTNHLESFVFWKSLKPGADYIYDSRGTVYRYKGDFERALSDYTQALKLKPDLAESHLWRGVIYSQRGEKQKAVDDLKAALKGLDDPKLKQRAEEELRKLK